MQGSAFTSKGSVSETENMPPKCVCLHPHHNTAKDETSHLFGDSDSDSDSRPSLDDSDSNHDSKS